MFTKSAIALSILIALSSGALAGHKHHYDAANAYGRMSGAPAGHKHHSGATNAYGRSPSIDDLCRQTGPITLPAIKPICNTKDYMQW